MKGRCDRNQIIDRYGGHDICSPFLFLSIKMRELRLVKPHILCILLIGLLSYGAFAQKGRVPAFASYPAKVEAAHAKSINFRADRANRTFRTRLSEALRGGVNFA